MTKEKALQILIDYLCIHGERPEVNQIVWRNDDKYNLSDWTFCGLCDLLTDGKLTKPEPPTTTSPLKMYP